jgi:phytoene dehydrogenase-like protein
MSTNTYDVIVLGSDIDALVAANQHAKAGKRVLVIEERDIIGGASVSEELIPGFRFNTVADDVGHVPPDMAQQLRLPRLPPELSVTTLGSGFTLARDMERTIASIRARSVRDAEAWPAFAELMHKAAGFLATLYAAPAPRPIDGGLGDLFSMAMVGKRARSMGRLDMMELLRIMPMSVYELLNDYFETDALKATLAGQGITSLHQGPMSAGTTFTLLHYHVGQEPGGFRLRDRFAGGTGTVANALARELTIATGTRVEEIVVRNGRAVGVRTASDEITADKIISSLDLKRTLIDLVDVAQLDPEFTRTVQHVRSRGVVARIHLALSEVPRFDGVSEEEMRGVLSVAPNLQYLERAYDDVKYGRASSQPYLELRVPSLTDASLAPAGRHTMSISMQYVPYDADPDAVGDAAVRTLAQYAPNLARAIIDRRVFTPRDLERTYGLPQGSVEHVELGLDQILFMRPVPECARHATPIDGLFLCGPGTHPGRAIAGASGRLV